MQRSKVFAYSQCHHKKEKTRSHLELTSVRNEKRDEGSKPSRDVDELRKPFWESTKGLPPGKALLISKQVLSVMPSYPIMCLWYVWCSLTLLMAALWYHQDRWHTQLSRLLTSIFYCNIEGEHLSGRGNSESKKRRRKKQPGFHCSIKYKWINGPCWADGISRHTFPYRLSRLYDHDILIDVTNNYDLFSLGINGICFRVLCMCEDGMNYSGGNRLTLIPSSLKYCDFYFFILHIQGDEHKSEDIPMTWTPAFTICRWFWHVPLLTIIGNNITI